jgi:hypothetical protein
VLIFVLWTAVAVCVRLYPPATPLEELAFWQAALAAVLLSSPLTWAMNTVWLLPSMLVLVRLARVPLDRADALASSLCAAGLLMAAAPDHHTRPLLAPWASLLNRKYVLAELVVLVAMLLVLRAGARRRA